MGHDGTINLTTVEYVRYSMILFLSLLYIQYCMYRSTKQGEASRIPCDSKIGRA